MSTDVSPTAIVEDCQLDAFGKVTRDIQVTLYNVEARMLVPADTYSEGMYLIRIIKPEGMGHLMPERGTSMDHGKFSFNSTEKVPKGTQLKVEITPVG
jgi:hypothetical protein